MSPYRTNKISIMHVIEFNSVLLFVYETELFSLTRNGLSYLNDYIYYIFAPTIFENVSKDIEGREWVIKNANVKENLCERGRTAHLQINL